MFNGSEITPTNSGISVLTASNWCYTFNNNGLYKSHRVGYKYGLEMTLNIYQETYWSGNDAAGLEVGWR